MMNTREALSAALWAVHEAAQDASNDPSRDSVREVKDAMRKVERLLPAF